MAARPTRTITFHALIVSGAVIASAFRKPGATERFVGNLNPFSRSYRRLRIPTAIGAAKLLPDAAREAKSLQLLHRFGWLIGKRVKGVCGKAELRDSDVTALECEPAEPSHRSTLVAIGIAVSQQQADAQRIVKGYLWKLTGRGEHEVGVPRLERASEASVWTAGVSHCERMFAPWSN